MLENGRSAALAVTSPWTLVHLSSRLQAVSDFRRGGNLLFRNLSPLVGCYVLLDWDVYYDIVAAGGLKYSARSIAIGS
ncbi:hypothetical protein BDV23DRAFT_149622 [Aspergillus alliaceus]|uniref:Uncharacterized protein n=1 Tax=Petromyces alliaceus TaxID=209559 RepID=A0A5N7CGT8_PETAA|nr:hypothetical protein BDV23DRAFT_149622 [Aspergillus alliaceus]